MISSVLNTHERKYSLKETRERKDITRKERTTNRTNYVHVSKTSNAPGPTPARDTTGTGTSPKVPDSVVLDSNMIQDNTIGEGVYVLGPKTEHSSCRFGDGEGGMEYHVPRNGT